MNNEKLQQKIEEVKNRLSPEGYVDRGQSDDMRSALDWFKAVRRTRKEIANAENLLADKNKLQRYSDSQVERIRRELTHTIETVLPNQVEAVQSDGYTIDEIEEELGDFSDDELFEIQKSIFVL